MENKVYAHIQLKNWDIIRMPWAGESYAKVEYLLDGKLICSTWCNMFYLPHGFFYKINENENIFEPIFDEKR